MAELWNVVRHSHMLHGALVGISVAARVDYVAFKTWHSWHDAASYEWSTATWRWFEGAVIGATAGAGFGFVAA